MFKPSARELAFVKGDGEQARPEEDDYDVWDAPAPVASRWKAWAGVAGLIVVTGLAAWGVTSYLDPQSADRPAAVATLGTMSPAAAPSPTPTGPAGPVVGEVPIAPRALLVDLVEPQLLGGRPRSSEEAPEPDGYLASFTDGELVSGAYGEPSAHNFVVMTAVTSTQLLYPDSQIDLLLGHLQLEDPNLTGLQPVPAGPLGGLSTCGSSKFADVPKAVCVWVGEQSMGVLVWIGMQVAEAKEDLLVLRPQIEVPLVS